MFGNKLNAKRDLIHHEHDILFDLAVLRKTKKKSLLRYLVRFL